MSSAVIRPKEKRATSLLWSDPAGREKGGLAEGLRWLACFCARAIPLLLWD